MATAAKKAAPAAKTAVKTAPAPAAKKTAAKPAPAPAPEPEATEEEEGVEVVAGSRVKFLGYSPDTPENEQVLTADTEYDVAEVTGEGNIVVRIDNPDFDKKKKENPDTNPRHLEVEVFPAEVEVVSGPAEEVAEEAPAAPAKKTAKKAVKPAEAAPEEPVEEVDEDDMPDLEGEDESVIALVESSEDLIATAQELEQQVSNTEFQLGGVLFHIRKDKLHRAIVGEDNKPVEAYNEKGGFGAFLADYFNIDYRKAMYLIEIYVNFTQAKIENPGAAVAQMGWTKASKIAKHLTAEGANPAELIELANTSTVTELSEAIKEQTTVGGTPGERVVRITLKFRYLEEEANAISSTLERAKEQLALKDIGQALAHILTEWDTANGGGQATQKSAPTQTKAAGAKPTAAKAAPKRAPVAAAA